MELVAQEVGGRGTLLGISGDRKAQFLAVTGYAHEAIDSFTADYADKSFVWSLLAGAAAGDLIHDRQVLSAERRRDDVFANEWATRNDTADCVVMPLVKRPGMSAVAVVARSIRSGAFDQPEIATLRRLVPHLQRAIEVHDRLCHSERQLALTRDILDRYEHALVLVTGNAVVTYCNKAAEDLMRDRGSELSLVRSRLACRRASDTALLRRTIAAAAGIGNGGQFAGGLVSIEREKHPWPLTIYCLPMADPSQWSVDRQPAVLLLLADTSRSVDLSPLTLNRLFGLTAAEARLALQLVQGNTLAQAAGSLGVARSTVASQLQGIFQKTHTRRQPDLVRLLHALPRLDLRTHQQDAKPRRKSNADYRSV
jgi:DNA-binding CsgD family transcriptional regulator